MLAESFPLVVHQAYFGAVNGISHGQLASSLPDVELRAFLVAFTDRPGALPPGVTLPPYLTAAVHGPYYLVSRTWPDTAVARPGMVFTHVLLLPLPEAGTVPDLTIILDLLLVHPPAVAERPAALAPLTLVADAVWEPAGEQQIRVPDSWLPVARQLVEQAIGSSVFVRGEAKEFELLLAALWRGLPAPLRTALTWGIRFIPPGPQDATPFLVSIPTELAPKWRGKDTLSLTSTMWQPPGTLLEQFVFGGEQQQPFRQFLADLQLRLDSFRVLKLCQRAYELSQKLRQHAADDDELLVLVRLLHALQPDPDKAVASKELAIAALAQALASDTGPQALALRNLPVAAFRTGAAQLGPAVSQSVRRLVLNPIPAEAAQTSLLTQLAETDPARMQPWWQYAADAAFTQALAPGTLAGAAVVWRGLLHSAATRHYALQAIPEAAAWEQLLQQNIPVHVLPEAAVPVADFSVSRAWWDLSATIAGAAYAPATALRHQLRAEYSLGLRTSPRVARLATNVPDTDLLECALGEWQTPQLQDLAGGRCVQYPVLLGDLDVRQPAWRAIWAAALRHTGSLTAGLREPAETMQAFLGEVASGRATEQLPLELAATSPFANVLHLPERPQLWARLPEKLRALFLDATLDALVEAILAADWTGTVETVLATAAQGRDFNTRLLHQRRNDPAAVLVVEAGLHNLRDEYFRDYLALLPALDAGTAPRVGKLVAAKRWSRSAEVLLARAKTSADFRPAVRACAGMFSLWDKIFNSALFNHQTSTQDVWQLLEQTMKDLYEKGPDESGIWRKAGGDPTRLVSGQTRAEQWEGAIRLLRQGGGGAATAGSLVQAALAQFPQNPNLKALADYGYLFKP